MFRVLAWRTLQLLVMSAALGSFGCSGDSSPTSPTFLPFAPFSQTDLRVGAGAEATVGQQLTVHFTGWLYDPRLPEQKGQQFDTSVGREPFTFTLGAGQVITGFDQGVVGMQVGGQRRLIIPPDLAFGPAGSQGGAVPPNATLLFDVELLEVQG